MGTFNALCTESIKNLQLDAGILATGVLNIQTWDGKLKRDGLSQITGFQDYKTLGATKGSISISIIPEIRNLFEGIDGARGYYKGGTVIDTWDITVKATLTEMTLTNINNTLAAAKNEVPGGSGYLQRNNYKIIQPELEIKTTPQNGYIENLYWIGSMTNGTPIIIEFKNALNMNGFNITAEDKNTGTYEVEFRPHIDLARPTEVPVKIFLPTDKGIHTRKFEEVKIDLKK